VLGTYLLLAFAGLDICNCQGVKTAQFAKNGSAHLKFESAADLA
jgi:hypothetical protein